MIKKLKDPINVANAFMNFFITITETLNIQQRHKVDAITILKDSFSGNLPTIKIIPITEAQTKYTLPTLPKTKKS